MQKDKFKQYDRYLQKWLYCYAFTPKQAKVLLRNQALALNGKFSFTNKPERVTK